MRLLENWSKEYEQYKKRSLQNPNWGTEGYLLRQEYMRWRRDIMAKQEMTDFINGLSFQEEQTKSDFKKQAKKIFEDFKNKHFFNWVDQIIIMINRYSRIL